MITLYYSPIACSLAPHIVLEETGTPFHPHRVNLADGEQLTDEYRRINPRQRVPALDVDGEIITEVPALLTYIASLRPEAELVPAAGTIAYARCFELLAFLSSSLHVAYAQFRRPQRFLPVGPSGEKEFIEQGRQNSLALYREVEARMNGTWALGERYSIADAYLLPFYLWGDRIGLDMRSDSPRWSAWFRQIIERPAVQRALAREDIFEKARLLSV